MSVEYALSVLKQEKSRLDELLNPKNPEKFLTRTKHQLASIIFSIEILETYEDGE